MFLNHESDVGSTKIGQAVSLPFLLKGTFNLLVESMTVHLLGNRDSRFKLFMLQVLSKF